MSTGLQNYLSRRATGLISFGKGPGLLLLIFLLCIYLGSPEFFRIANLTSVLYYTCLLVPALMGMHLLVTLGHFDLSVGAVAALSGVVAATCLRSGIPWFVCVIAAGVAGMVFGTLNWLMVSRARMPALIATMISLGAARACTLGISHGQVIGGLPSSVGYFTLGQWGFVSPIVVLALSLVLLLSVFSSKHVLLRRMYLAGSSRSALENVAVSVVFLEWVAFVSAGVGAACVGMLQASRTLSAAPLVFADLALECIAACVIGGSRLSGGTGNPIGSFVGMLIVVVSRNLVILADVSVYWRDLGVALVLFAAVLMNPQRVPRGGASS